MKTDLLLAICSFLVITPATAENITEEWIDLTTNTSSRLAGHFIDGYIGIDLGKIDLANTTVQTALEVEDNLLRGGLTAGGLASDGGLSASRSALSGSGGMTRQALKAGGNIASLLPVGGDSIQTGTESLSEIVGVSTDQTTDIVDSVKSLNSDAIDLTRGVASKKISIASDGTNTAASLGKGALKGSGRLVKSGISSGMKGAGSLSKGALRLLG